MPAVPQCWPNQTPGGGAAQVGNETFWSIGKGESKQVGASGEPWRRRHGRAEGIAPGWLVPSVCLILGLAGRPSWMVDGRRQQTWPFYSCLDQIYTEFGLFICIIHVYA